jgi:cellulose biosynthesis protein BcsQ
MKTVMVASTKGGTAKTTSVIALAATWATEHGKKVALWDGDPQGTLTRQMRLTVVRDPWVADPVPVRIPEMEETSVLFRGGRALGLTGQHQVRRFFERPDWDNRLGADLAVLDTPPGGLVHILAAADVADLLLVPVDTTPLGLEGLIETMDLLRVIEPPVPTRVLLTRVVSRRSITNRISGWLDERYPGIRLAEGIPEDVRVPESHDDRRPVTLGPRGRAAESYRAVAAHLLDVLGGIRRVDHTLNPEALASGSPT